MIDQILSLSPLLLGVVCTALIFDFVNGWNDSANAIATIIGTRVLRPISAVLLAAAMNMIGALAGTAVAKMIYSGLIITGPGFIEGETVIMVVLAAMIGAIIWAAWMTIIGMPVSGSHSLIGGLAGAAVAAGGIKVLQGSGITKVLLAMLLSPLLGGIVAFLLLLALYWTLRGWRPHTVKNVFSLLQIASCSFMGFTHGLNDAQKVMGVITLALIAGQVQSPDEPVLLWVKIACGVMISLGTALGGWKVIKTLGSKLSELDPLGGFVAETGASLVLSGAALVGVPVSTTHTITGAIMGVGAKRGILAVRWGVGGKILLAWIMTLPATMVLSGTIYSVLVMIQ